MFGILSRRHREDVRVLEHVRAMRAATGAPASVPEHDTVELPLQLVRLMVPAAAR